MIVETTELTKYFERRSRKSSERVTAVAGIDLAVKESEVFGFLGPNGAGKSTTMRMLTTLLKPDSGSATIAGFDLFAEADEVRRHIGYVAQSSTTGPDVTAREELIMQCGLYGIGRREAVRRTEEALEAYDIGDYADRRCRTYSGGQRRRLDLALGTVHGPSLLLLDEPSAGLDPQSRVHLWDEIRRLRTEGMTVFITTHYLDEADVLCDRLSIIDHGSIVATGTPGELKRELAGETITVDVADGAERAATLLEAQGWIRAVTTGSGSTLRIVVDDAATSVPRVVSCLEIEHIAVVAVELHRVSLDDVFLSKTGRSLRD